MVQGGKFVRAGEYIFKEGNFSDSAYIIGSGSVEILEEHGDGKQKIIGVLYANDIFGEIGLVSGLPRTASARALEDSRIHILSKETFDTLCKQNPHVLMPIMKVLANRLNETLKILKSGYKMPGKDRRDSGAPPE